MKIIVFLTISSVIIQTGYCAAPVIHGLPTSVNVGELEYKGRLIYELTVSDVNGDSFVCRMQSVSPSPNNTNVDFRVLIDSANGKYGVYLINKNEGTSTNPNVMFNFDIEQTFNVFVVCTDARNTTTNPIPYLRVDIIDNDKVEFTNLPDTVSKDATATMQNDIVYTVQVQNELTTNDNGLSFSIATVPPSSSFDIDGNGNILAARNLVLENTSPIFVYVTVTDGVIWVKETLRVDLTNMNNIPEITNLKNSPSVHMSELLASSSLIYSLTGNDGDASDTLTYSMNIDPVTDTALFELDTTVNPLQLRLASGKNFDYEKTQYYNITFTVTDSKATGGPFILNVHVLDENEPCYFDKSTYSLSTYEGAAGSISLNPGFIIRDGDGTNQGYSLSFLNGNGSERFTMDASSGLISYATDYDIDNSAMPSTVYLNVKCQDITGETGNASVIIYIHDINDNAPVFNSGEYSFFADQFTGVGSLIGTTTATDIDSGTNAQFTCSYGSTQNAIANTYYTVGSDCSVFFTSRTALSYDTVIRFTLLATDKGSPAKTGTTYVNAIYREASTTTISTSTTTTSTTSTTTTTAAPSTGLEDGSIAAIVIGSIVGAVLLGLLLYMLFRWCYTGFCCGPDPCDFARCCQRGDYSNYQRRQVTPIRSRQRIEDRRRDSYELDSDYGSLKNQDMRHSRFSRPERNYPDFPQVGEPQFPRLSPSDARMEMISPKYTRGLPAIRY
ncbi:unnamed protein product [Mytilus coruscus]|uniref:Cadherin domain-containing protein n=1 Tax=Mytilus coruscus TaxID=42192 RepID=A0A6J8E0Q4_MYTCO|nr:unnamed protein product [Mytilus coruscus]